MYPQCTVYTVLWVLNYGFWSPIGVWQNHPVWCWPGISVTDSYQTIILSNVFTLVYNRLSSTEVIGAPQTTHNMIALSNSFLISFANNCWGTSALYQSSVTNQHAKAISLIVVSTLISLANHTNSLCNSTPPDPRVSCYAVPTPSSWKHCMVVSFLLRITSNLYPLHRS